MSPAAAPTLISLAIGLESEEGHQFAYNRSVGRAAALLGWRHVAAVSCTCRIHPLPPGWTACLDRGNYRFAGNPFSKLNSVRRLARSITVYLRQCLLEPGPKIVFLEFFNDIQLSSLALALLALPPQRLSVWLLYRTNVDRQRYRIHVYRALHGFIRRCLGPNRLLFLSDSEPLARTLARCFGQPVTVMPIPHTTLAAQPPIPPLLQSARLNGKLLAWWPGRPAADKGLQTIRRLALTPQPDAPRLCLIAAEGAGLASMPGGCELICLPNELPRPEYEAILRAVDVVLLPYDHASYAERTSGIFVEAIFAGKPVLVPAGTWMAAELLRFDLQELMIDWERPDLAALVVQAAHLAGIAPKLSRMQACYSAFHSEAGYARVLAGLFENRTGAT